MFGRTQPCLNQIYSGELDLALLGTGGCRGGGWAEPGWPKVNDFCLILHGHRERQWIIIESFTIYIGLDNKREENRQPKSLYA